MSVISKKEISEILVGYDTRNLTISTLCSHSALQIFYGARQEGFKTIGICKPDMKKLYDSYTESSPNSYIFVEDYKEILEEKIQEQLREANAIIVPTGSFVEYVGTKNLETKFRVPMQGNRRVLSWESDRKKQRNWLTRAGLRVPEEYTSPSEIDRLCIVKFYGARGGMGFFVTDSEDNFYKEIKKSGLSEQETDYTIQEYIFGVRFYPHFHYSPLNVRRGWAVKDGRLELLGYDQRVESNVDELHRVGLSREERKKMDIHESFTVVGNRPLIPREKLEHDFYKIGEKIVNMSLTLFPPGILGPFCPETLCTKNLEIYIFEISARIVAGTNIWSPQGSPEAWYTWGEPMSMGRRIAREIKLSVERNMLNNVVF